MKTTFPIRRGVLMGILGGLLILGAGCKKEQSSAPAQQPEQQAASPARDDQQIAQDVQANIHAEPALNGQNIQVSVANGVVTLDGTAANDASRSLAGADSGSVDGVKTVINNLTVAPAERADGRQERDRKRQEKVAKAAPPPPPAPAPPPPPPAPTQEAVQTVAPPPPPPPPAPVAKTVTLPAGTMIPVRLVDTLDSASTQSNSVFHASLANDLIVDGMIAARHGAPVTGRVITAKDATHFSGSSELSIELTGVNVDGRRLSLVTDAYTVQGKGRGKNTAMKSGGGAVLGAVIGALAGGGKGAAIGAVTGGGVGAGVNGVTKGQQVQIPSETLVRFRLQSPISVTTSRQAGAAGSSEDNSDAPQLQRRQ